MTSKKNNVNTTSLPNEQELLSNYENPNYPYSFASKKTVYKYFPHLDKKVIDKTLLKSNIHTSFKKYRKPKQYLPIYVHGKRELFQVVLVKFFLVKKNIFFFLDGYHIHGWEKS